MAKPNCHDPDCHDPATHACYDEAVRKNIFFCDDHVDEWAAKEHITRSK